MFFWILFFISASVFLISFLKERRLFRNAIYLVISLFFLFIAVTFSTNGSIISLVIILTICFLMPFALMLVSFVFISAGVLSIKKEGLSLAHCLSIGFGFGIWAFFLAAWTLFTKDLSAPVNGLLILVLLMAAYILFTFVALFLYSLLYQLVPKTAFYYWPNAFVREYIAIIIQYKIIPILIFSFWALGFILSLHIF